ncbi:hypothetical protein [Cohnella cholangitidis]|uniref:Uncharacterized protein n=1 Tax=Cohnella cholangitidis TaxID=2598458 RepID=A0A7G5C4H0_9BACL|nr:hypothetical protein [Cohnella cholangitidis]QMV44104.1 hypothetical protein FPL14_25240 [Cohnella cholangitidis]
MANLLNSNGTDNKAKPPAASAIATDPVTKLPADVPADIPILDGAKGITAVRTGDGVTKGDGFYQLSFRVASGLEETATIYRNKLEEKKYDYEDEPVADSVSLTGNTPSWIFYLTIAKSTEVKGETSVTISYTK